MTTTVQSHWQLTLNNTEDRDAVLTHRRPVLLLLPGNRRQALLQRPDRLLVVVKMGAELGVVVAELQVPAAQIQDLLPQPGVLQRRNIGRVSVFQL